MKANFRKPMLCHDWYKHKHKLKYPVFVQPKLDGVRCVAVVSNSVCTLYSRTGKIFPCIPHINTKVEEFAAKNNLRELIMDGELFDPDLTFEEIISRVKRTKTQHEDSESVGYFPFQEFRNGIGDASMVETMVALDEAQVDKFMAKAIDEGYEGVVVRESFEAKNYEWEKRSQKLLKYKPGFLTEEFRIVGWDEGKGKLEGCLGTVTVVCAAGLFACKIAVTDKRLRQMWDDRHKLVGKWITIKFQNKSAKGYPRFPIGLEVRDYE